MPEDEDRPFRVKSHEIGMKLDDLSVGDFDERIALLRVEIERLEAARHAKRQARRCRLGLSERDRNVTGVAKRDMLRFYFGKRARSDPASIESFVEAWRGSSSLVRAALCGAPLQVY